MSANSKIEWTDHTFNPWMGCQKVSPACDHCYAEVNTAVRSLGVVWGPGAERRRTSAGNWQQPVRWNAEAARLGIRYRVFCASLADVFDNAVPDQWRSDLFDLIAATPHLDWLLLTKRIGNARSMLNAAASAVMGDFVGANAWDMHPWPNVWIGATICNQEEADRDIPKLLAVDAKVRFLSMEPLLGPVTLDTIYNTDLGEGQPYLHPLIGRVSDGHGDGCNVPGIDWVIVGGESGHHARPMNPDWVRSLRDQCQAAGVPFLFKQWGEWLPGSQAREVGNQMALVGGCDRGWKWDNGTHSWHIGKKAAGRLLDGRTWDDVPGVEPVGINGLTEAETNATDPRDKDSHHFERKRPDDTEGGEL